MHLLFSAANVLFPPFQLSECLIVCYGGIEANVAHFLRKHGVSVCGFISSAGGYSFNNNASLISEAIEVLFHERRATPETPVLISKQNWVRTKSALFAAGCRNFAFIEDLIFPRREWSDEFKVELKYFTDTPEDLSDEISYLFRDRAGIDAGISSRAAEAAITFAKDHEIGCKGFGQADLSMVSPMVHIMAAAGYDICPGPIVEIGAYCGGMTCSLGLLARKAGFPVFSFELGISHPTHPTHPTSDTLSDMHDNIAVFGIEKTVTIIPDKFENAFSAIGDAVATMLVIDAYGDVRDKMNAIQGRLAPGAFVIVDDYFQSGRRSTSKCRITRAHVNELVAAGVLEEIDIVRYGTWIGRYRK